MTCYWTAISLSDSPFTAAEQAKQIDLALSWKGVMWNKYDQIHTEVALGSHCRNRPLSCF